MKLLTLIIYHFYCLHFFVTFANCDVYEQYCKVSNDLEEENSCKKYGSLYNLNKRYILYDVNPPEGFNLRRDVYIRVAVFVKNLAAKDRKYQWHLVLPPWGNLYHWKSRDLGPQKQLPWGTFFDIPSFQKYAPVIEMHQFLKEFPSKNYRTILDQVHILQNDEEMFKTGEFEDKNEKVPCTGRTRFKKFNEEEYAGNFWGFSNVTTRAFDCVVFHGFMSGLEKNLQPSLHSSVMFDHMEIPLHDSYGSVDYWKARRSMRYNAELYDVTREYRKMYLESDDVQDNTQRPSDWTEEKGRRNALGGPYLAVHLRRGDFLYSRLNSLPSMKNAAAQLKKKMIELNLNTVFVATDAEEKEFNELKKNLSDYKVFRYVPTKDVRNKFKDGGIAIIDQIICSHSRYFLGTEESTYTFRIQEEREILGFPTNTTFNYLCKKEKCASSGRWEIVW